MAFSFIIILASMAGRKSLVFFYSVSDEKIRVKRPILCRVAENENISSDKKFNIEKG